MKIETKFDVGGNIFCLDKYGNIKERKIFGIRTQEFINGSQKTIYSFVKDGVLIPTLQEKCHLSMQRTISSGCLRIR